MSGSNAGSNTKAPCSRPAVPGMHTLLGQQDRQHPETTWQSAAVTSQMGGGCGNFVGSKAQPQGQATKCTHLLATGL